MNWYGWLIIGFVLGFIICMFLGLTVMYYTQIQERKKNVSINGGGQTDSE
jgi:hypothetical protein